VQTPALQKEKKENGAWWCTPIILTFGRVSYEDHDFEASLGYLARLESKENQELGIEHL
jgi:hypothetical protein